MIINEYRSFIPYTQGADNIVTNWVVEMLVDTDRVFQIQLSPLTPFSLDEWKAKKQDLISWVELLNASPPGVAVDDTPLTILGWDRVLEENKANPLFLDLNPPGIQNATFVFNP